MRLRVVCLAAALALPTTTAVAGADAGEFLVDPDVAYAPAELNQLYAAAASNGVNSLIVWADERGGSNSDIYGTRFSGQSVQGTVLDPAGLVISAAASAQTVPAVASDGTDYFVAWADQREDTSDIYACRVTSDGAVLDPDGILVSAAAGFQGEPAVAFDGTNYLVVWTDMRGGESDIYGARVTRDGVLVDTSGLTLVDDDSTGQAGPAVIYDGSNFLLVWEETRSGWVFDIYGARVNSGGTLLDSAGFPISLAQSWQGSPAIALGDDEALVVWEDMRGGPATDIYGSRITSAGEVLDSAGIAIATSTWYEFDPKVTFDGTQYLVVWTDAVAHGNVFGGRVATDGTVVDTLGFFVSQGGEYAGNPTVAFDGMYNVVAWNDVRAGMSDHSVSVARVDGNGLVLDGMGIPVSNAACSQKLPDAVFGATDFLVVWGESRAGISDIYGVRLTTEGTAVDSTGFRISPRGGEQTVAGTAHGGSNYLVVWEEGRFRERDVCGARVDHDGVVADTAGILISGSPWEQCAPAVESDGTDFLVAWQDWRNSSYDIYCARVSHTGTVLDTAGVAVCTASGNQVTPAVAYNGTDYLVLWQYQGVGIRDIYGARVSRQGVVLEPDGFMVSAAAGTEEQPAAASDGDNFLVVWSDWRNADRDVYGARVTGSGTVLDTAGIEICSAPGAQDCPAVECDGTDFLVVWQDQRNGEYDLYGARVTAQGTILDTFAVITQQSYQVNPALACGGGTKMLLAYSGWTGVVDDLPYNSPRIWATLSPAIATGEGPNAAAPVPQPAATIVRGVLLLPYSPLSTPRSLFSVDGRKALDLQPGDNDIRGLGPGVYYVAAGARAPASQAEVRKVILVE
jgi:hypothetical protein